MRHWRSVFVAKVVFLAGSSTVHDFTPEQSENIDEIITTYLSGDVLTPQQSFKLESWIAASAENRTQLDQMRATWQTLGQRSIALPAFHEADTSERLPRRSSVVGQISRWRTPAWVAAGLAAAFVAFMVQRSVWAPELQGAQHFATTSGQTSNVRLDDGTVIRLGPGSRLDVAAGSGGRDVRLTGQAFFAVTHQAGAPFRVHTLSGDVKVLGTRFNVNSDSARTDLVVVDGRVELSAGTRRVEVTGGEVSHAERGDVAPAIAVSNVYSRLGWMSGAMLFNATPLARVADELEHRFGVRVEVDSSLREHTVTAVFNDRRLPDVIDVVCRVVDANCTTVPDSGLVRMSARSTGM
jgi:transmembrane sensor